MSNKLILKKVDKNIFAFILIFLFCIFSSILILFTAAKFNWDNSLTLLASQFLKAHVSLEPANNLPLGDIALYGGKYYLYFGLFPSILLMPFVAVFGNGFPQITIGILSMLISFFATFSISKYFKFNRPDALFLAIFIVFSTVLFGSSLINITAYQVESLGFAMLMLSIEKYITKRSMTLSGLFLGFAVLTRFTLIFAGVFFAIEFLKKRLSKRELTRFLIPFVTCLIIFGIYNFIRFNSFVETGYNHIRPQPFPLSKNVEHGMFSLAHIPANLYSFLIMPPEPLLYYEKGFVLKFPYLKANPWGMAIWYTSPLFLLLLFRFKKWKYTFPALITAALLAIPLFTYFSVGFAQFGYRYTLDFLPFLFLLLLPSLMPKLTRTMIAFIILGVLFNCIYTTSLWEVYPLFGIK